MKNYLLLFCIAIAAACSKAKTPVAPEEPMGFNPATATVVTKGNFTGNMSYTVTGSAKLLEQNGKRYIYLDGFTTSSGPDLKLYLATNNTAAQFISLGALKNNSGNQVYELTGTIDFNRYNKVLIWCERFGVLFGASMLM